MFRERDCKEVIVLDYVEGVFGEVFIDFTVEFGGKNLGLEELDL